MLVEFGYVRAQDGGGREWTFAPSFGRLADLDTPEGLVGLYAALHGPRAERTAAFVLAGLCEQEDPSELIGWLDDAGAWHDGAMPPAERVILARHLMQHGMVGRARPEGKGREGGGYVTRFDAGEYIAAARVHLGLSTADAQALSMTELQVMLDQKFPPEHRTPKLADLPSAEEYEATMRHYREAGRV